jgi:elongation factor 2
VDFTGKVARALRAIDAAIVVVDAVEGIMAQTETVTRQALEERVRPILFINKVDRLIRELKLDADEIYEKSLQIVREFNDLIEIYGEREFKSDWKANSESGDVILGSALHRWGFKLFGAKMTEMNLANIIDAYGKNKQSQFSAQSPLHEAILDICVNSCPSPVEAQRYRIPKIWKGNTNSEIGKAMLNCDENGPTSICVTNVKVDPKAGIIATGRVFSGSVKKGDLTYLVGASIEETVQEVSLYMSSFLESAPRIGAGNIAALSGLNATKAGETIVSLSHKAEMQPFEDIKYVTEAIVTLAVEPSDPNDLPRLVQVMQKLAIEDPNLVVSVDQNTGENLLSGIGELHLETAIEFLKENTGQIEIRTSKPMIEYRESIMIAGSAVTAKSLNRKNSLTMRVEPVQNRAREERKEDKETWAFDEHGNNALVSDASDEVSQDIKNAVIAGFRWACSAGPLCAEPIRNVKASLLNVDIAETPDLLDVPQITKATSRAILGSFLTGEPVILEPVYRIEISVPTQWMGVCIGIVTRRRGKIQMTEQKDMTAIIRGLIPVAETFGLTADMRSSTSGRAFWQCSFDGWQQIPEKLASEIIRVIRLRKGLPPDVPKASKFTD